MKFEIVRDEFRKHPGKELIVPKRATIESAGYDFYSPIDFEIPRKTGIKIWTDIKAKLDPGFYLPAVVRGSIGIKKKIMLMNTIAVIDGDYYNNPDNDGNIMFSLYNYGEHLVEIKAGEAICQGIISRYYKAGEEDVQNIRQGGFGSTDK